MYINDIKYYEASRNEGKPSTHSVKDFKPGDRIVAVCVHKGDWPSQLGKIATVIGPSKQDRNLLMVKWEDGYRTERHSFFAWRFEFAKALKCQYCGGLLENAGNFRVCTECFRKED